MDKLDKHKLISCVFMREPIWNKENKFHTHSLVLSKLWQEVATECGTTVKTAKMRWKNLREMFLTKIADTPSGDAFAEEHRSWPYFESLLFLKDQRIARRSKGDFPKQEDETSTLSSEGRDDEGEAPDMGELFFSQDTADFSREISPLHTSEFQPFPKKLKKDTEIDEDEAFFKSILPHVKALTPKEKIKFRINVMQLLDNELPSTTQPNGSSNNNND
ncbi:uncharacterized protein LOC114324524 isoform X2 [Diabrotica virgifera virgifera]|uniref:Uncharacterized protein LOC114324524 isoform X2 n=1 Tax=Diabrotica virgifera virgifera TaxID=50390 RepID=A0A6P7F3V9_DIAVI|nr:uncharacterized protein LOC114324524 isoform X2 [Diabrotica virgifera virgifera]